MAYTGLVVRLENYRKDPNSDNLYLAEVFGEGVIVGSNMKDGDLVLYLPQDGRIERWFGDELKLFRKNLDGSSQGGYIENNGHVRAIRLRGNQSSGIVIAYDRIVELFGEQNWAEGDKVTEINNTRFCEKYIPYGRHYGGHSNSKKTSKSTCQSTSKIKYPNFFEHADTLQLAYNLGAFKPGDRVNITLKMHGTSGRSMRTYSEKPRGFFRRLFKLPAKTKPAYICGTRRMTVTEENGGFYGNNAFRLEHHKAIEPFVEDGMEVFYEIVGWYGPAAGNTIMGIGNNKKMNDKEFVKKFGERTVFSYGCQPGQSAMWVYRITANNGNTEYTPEQITEWCKKAGVNRVPIIDDFIFDTAEDLMNRVNTYFEDLVDPIGGHIKEGVVVRIVNRPYFAALKAKTFAFKVLEGLIKAESETPDMEEAQEV